jgi:hypothetical protein
VIQFQIFHINNQKVRGHLFEDGLYLSIEDLCRLFNFNLDRKKIKVPINSVKSVSYGDINYFIRYRYALHFACSDYYMNDFDKNLKTLKTLKSAKVKHCCTLFEISPSIAHYAFGQSLSNLN